MDMSKLPRLSNTHENAPAPSADPAEGESSEVPTARPAQQIGHGSAFGAEVWLSVVLGIIFMLVGGNFGIYFADRAMNRPFHTHVEWSPGTPLAGQEVAYPDLQGFVMLTDASFFLFGLALFFDGIVLMVSAASSRFHKPMIYLGLAITAVAVAFNVYACGKLMSNGITPLISLLATAFGVYIGIHQWTMLKSASR